MIAISIQNPFNAPVYHEETVSSTMDVSRQLAADFPAHGTVIAADFQEAGRGRISGRKWEMDRGANLPFTVLLRYPRIEDIPAALTLRAGLAVSLAVEDFVAENGERITNNNEQRTENDERLSVQVKWPNDVMIGGKKTAGILCEVIDRYVHLGIGINVAQTEFPEPIRDKATSIALATNNKKIAANDARFLLLEKILSRLYDELETNAGNDWKSRLEQRLYKRGECVTFIEGAADSGKIVTGFLTGIGEGGELLILPDGGNETRSFVAGELKI